MSISSLGAGIASFVQAKPQPNAAPAPSGADRAERPHRAHGHGGGKPPASTDPASQKTSATSTGTVLNSLV